jgi:hypothetical protein
MVAFMDRCKPFAGPENLSQSAVLHVDVMQNVSVATHDLCSLVNESASDFVAIPYGKAV